MELTYKTRPNLQATTNATPAEERPITAAALAKAAMRRPEGPQNTVIGFVDEKRLLSGKTCKLKKAEPTR